MSSRTNQRIFTILAAALFACSSLAASSDKIHLTFDHFYDHQELTESLMSLRDAYPDFMTVKSLGKSYQGREIWGIIINNPETGPAKHKSGFYIDANIHGNEIQGTEVALYAIWYLLTRYGESDLATRLLDERAFYVIPTMNPDARDQFINGPTSDRSGLIPVDDDKDGRADEDGYDDLNGDGLITQMRKKDTHGNLKPHPENPNILVSVKPGEKGIYRSLGMEGIDNDGDGRINEDQLGRYDMNRNYGMNWQPDYIQRGAGNFPFCYPETAAARDFLLAHPNIMGGQCFHNSGGMILRGPGAISLGDYAAADVKIYDQIGKTGEKILPGYTYMIAYKDLYTAYGSALDFMYLALGIFCYTNELDKEYFTTADMEGAYEFNDQRRISQYQIDQMFYQEHVMLKEAFIEWKPFHHPLYGDIEIGGLTKFARRVPPLFKLAETCHRNASFCFYHADQLPLLEFEDIRIEKVGKNLFQVDVTVSNTRLTPTISAHAARRRLHRADRLTIEGKDCRLIAAGNLTDKFRNLTSKIKTQDNSIWIDSGISSFGKRTFRLLIEGNGDIEFSYDSLKGGFYTKPAVLKESP